MGRIFAVDELSVFDGPGLRMSVFLKGCPLRCVWCHSPEGRSYEKQMLRAPAGCIGCGNCLIDGALRPESVTRCPRGLVRECGEDITAEALCQRILRLRGMMDGVTFSGGEPLMQGDFLLACLQGLEGKMHRAVQTCGYAPADTFAATLARTDYLLMDLKLMDPTLHRYYTGVDNAPILKNYQQLAASGLPFITRLPLIPTVTDTVENITAMAAFLRENGVDRVELLPYNSLAGAKYKAAGLVWQPPFDETIPSNPRKELWENYGIEVKIL